MDSFYVEMVSGQRPQSVKIIIPNLTNTNKRMKIGVPCHKNECPPTILIQTKSFIVSTN